LAAIEVLHSESPVDFCFSNYAMQTSPIRSILQAGLPLVLLFPSVTGAPVSAAPFPQQQHAKTSRRDLDRATPDDIARKIAAAELQVKEGRFPQAIEAYQDALARQPSSEIIELALADLYERVHNDEQARKILQIARRRHPQSIGVLRATGILEMDLQAYDASIGAFRAALRIAPLNRDLRNLLATAYLKKGDAQSALRELNIVLSHNPADTLARYLRAGIHADQGDNEKALADTEKVITAKPVYLPARILYAKILVRLKDCQRAAEALRPAEQAPRLDGDGLFLLASAYDCAGKKDLANEARAEFEQVSRIEHEKSENRVQSLHLVEQANALAMQNQLSHAQDLLRQALEKNPENAFAYSQQAKIYVSLRQPQEARAAIDKAMQIQPYQPDFLFVLGVIEAGEGNLEAALSSFQAVTCVNPQEADAFFEIGKIWMQKGDRSQALTAFRRAAELSPSDADYRQALRSASERQP
jgi:tetratricopeptide (TPR) repeat protein